LLVRPNPSHSDSDSLFAILQPIPGAASVDQFSEPDDRILSDILPTSRAVSEKWDKFSGHFECFSMRFLVGILREADAR